MHCDGIWFDRAELHVPTRLCIFDDLCSVLQRLGFDKRVKGSHHVFRKSGIEERINLQRDGNTAKPYQVKQVRSVILKYKLGEGE
jgi:predicted RNA binding protein YcfA (HicA-like mRNA interferase family)